MVSALRDAGQELDIELMQCEKAAEEIIDKIREAKRPVIVAGTGVRISDTVEDLQCLAEVEHAGYDSMDTTFLTMTTNYSLGGQGPSELSWHFWYGSECRPSIGTGFTQISDK